MKIVELPRSERFVRGYIQHYDENKYWKCCNQVLKKERETLRTEIDVYQEMQCF